MLKPHRRPQTLPAVLCLLAAVIGTHVQAHEFWIEPIRFEIAAGDLLQAAALRGFARQVGL